MPSPGGGIPGPIVTVDEQQYFVMGKNRIKITEHFPATGKQVDELIADLITNKIKKNPGKLLKIMDKPPHLW